ncbi:hypothetical protein FACS1894139_03450 [Planctomycetales bacterium]|nr:hypothetical protein FACS1894107_11230 [Planctomycetales bacterium]GHT00523.1 hypothetical protein FACS1894108_12780 [Planctomycetales bacterium]GHT03357.1 hypothetical protein FACS1894139_03450 [Planctomycetales bacterium]
MSTCDPKRFENLKADRREYLMFAADAARDFLRRRPFSREALLVAANSLTTLGFYEDGLAFDRRLFELAANDPVVVYNYACSQALNGDFECAFSLLEQAIRLGYRNSQQIRQDPDWEAARDDPRFSRLLNLAEKQCLELKV